MTIASLRTATIELRARMYGIGLEPVVLGTVERVPRATSHDFGLSFESEKSELCWIALGEPVGNRTQDCWREADIFPRGEHGRGGGLKVLVESEDRERREEDFICLGRTSIEIGRFPNLSVNLKAAGGRQALSTNCKGGFARDASQRDESC